PDPLVPLAMQSLLRNKVLTISDLAYLPITFFPSLFKEAYTGRHMEILKLMVAAWPFPCLPVGSLMKTSDVEALQALLDCIDMLQSQKVRPRRRKLQEVDLRNVHQDFWDGRIGTLERDCLTETGSEQQVGKSLRSHARRRLLKVVIDLSLSVHLKEHQRCLLQWAQHRKGSVRLCCLKMNICLFPVDIIKEVLDIFQPDCVEELEVSTNQVLHFLGHFAPCFDRMRNLRKFRLTHIYLTKDKAVHHSAHMKEKWAVEFLSHFSKLNCLQHLCLDGVNFTCKHMIGMFSGVVFAKSRCTHLRVLLENVAGTLQTLELVRCSMEDSQLSDILPALSQCSQLTRANFYDNNFSTAGLKNLLESMGNLNKLTVELYPAPLECYDLEGNVLVEKFTQICPELMDILIGKRNSKTIIIFATYICLECCKRCIYDMETQLCSCWQ
ncbi:PRAME family member 8-like, partial [Sigmodon hispidus]